MEQTIIITERTNVNGQVFEPFFQYCSTGTIMMIPEWNEQNIFNNLNFKFKYLHYTVIKNDVTCYICSDYAVPMEECVNPNLPNNWKSGQVMPEDKTKDYYAAVMKYLGIDLRKSSKPEYNGEEIYKKRRVFLDNQVNKG